MFCRVWNIWSSTPCQMISVWVKRECVHQCLTGCVVISISPASTVTQTWHGAAVIFNPQPKIFFQNHKTKKVRKLSVYNLAVGCWMELPQPLICSLFWQEKYVKKTRKATSSLTSWIIKKMNSQASSLYVYGPIFGFSMQISLNEPNIKIGS